MNIPIRITHIQMSRAKQDKYKSQPNASVLLCLPLPSSTPCIHSLIPPSKSQTSLERCAEHVNIQILKRVRSRLVQHLQHVRQLLAMRSLLCSRWWRRSRHHGNCSCCRLWSIRSTISLLLPSPDTCNFQFIPFKNTPLRIEKTTQIPYPVDDLVAHGRRQRFVDHHRPTVCTWDHWDSLTDSTGSLPADTDSLRSPVAAVGPVAAKQLRLESVRWCCSSLPFVPSFLRCCCHQSQHYLVTHI